MSTAGDGIDNKQNEETEAEENISVRGSPAKRKRTLTDRGRTYQKDILSQQLKAAYSKIKRQCILFSDLLLSNDVDMVHKESANLDMRLSEAVDLHNRLLDILLEDEIAIQLSKHEEIDNHVFTTKQQICSWLKSQDTTSRSGRSTSRHSGSRASSHGTRKTHKSKDSSKRSVASNHSNISENWLKIASLEAEQRVIEQRQCAKKVELESKLQHETAKMEAEKMMVQQQIIKAKLEEGIAPQEKQSDQINQNEIKYVKSKSTDAVERINHEDQVIDVMKRLIDLHAAPDIEIDIFSGDPLEYRYFRTTFREVVETKVHDARGRLTRLLKFTSGDAKELIKNCIYEDKNTCFDAAIALLDKEYGNQHIIVNKYLHELRHWPTVKLNDEKEYKKFSRFLRSGTIFQRDGKLKELNSESIIRSFILSKMDRTVQERWLRKVVSARAKHGKELVFSDLVEFIEYESLLASDPSYSQGVYKKDVLASSGIKAFTTQIELSGTDKKVLFKKPCLKVKCPLCDGEHKIDGCSSFTSMNLENRGRAVYHNRLCYGCLEPINDEHVGKSCNQRKTCDICKESHPTLLHGNVFKVKSHSIHHDSSSNIISMSIVPVRLSHADNSANVLKVYALLDENSQGIFVQEDLLDKLQAPTRRTCIRTETINGVFTDSSLAVDGLQVSPLSEFETIYGNSAPIKLPTSYSREVITFNEEEVPTADNIKHWNHLHSIIEKLPAYDSTIPLGLIIGANCPKALEPHEVIPSCENGPYALRSPLGWRVIGPIGGRKVDTSVNCYRTRLVIPSDYDLPDSMAHHHLVLESSVKDNYINQGLEKMYQHEFPEEKTEKISLSQEDHQFVNLMQDSVYKENGHYCLPLPFRDNDPVLPSNKTYALHRLASIKRKMQKDESFKIDYCKFMNTLLEKGYAIQSDDTPEGRTWYIPHFGVREEAKQRIRVVFDCSAKSQERCLNDELLQGPDLTNMLVGVLLRFRLSKVGFMGDIEAMFHQVHVPTEQQTYLKFLWWPDGDVNQPPTNYQMRVHLFGAISSPSCANFALRQTTKDNPEWDEHICDVIRDNFYVDDMIKSEEDVEAAIHTVASVHDLCKTAGFNLTKYVSSHKEVTTAFPDSKKYMVVKELNQSDCIEQVLGVYWCIESDSLGFRITLQDTPLTRRGILSTISSIYDPLGIAGPFVLHGRKILQRITTLKDGWDSQVPEDLAELWREWRKTLPQLQNISIPRCYKPSSFQLVIRSSLHIFMDASEVGYGLACYLRQVNISGGISISFVFGKSRVTPTKQVTIPRLELTACTVGAKVGAMLKEELKIPDLNDFYLTDSNISLGYIKNDVKRFRIFVANRVQKIRSYTRKDQWQHIESQSNPADHASRGITVMNKEAVSQWLNGPKFLLNKTLPDAKTDYQDVLDENDPEIRKPQELLTVHASKSHESSYVLTRLEECYSSWTKIVRIIATMFQFVVRCRQKRQRSEKLILTVSDLKGAENTVIKMIQHKYLCKEYDAYKEHMHDSSVGKKAGKKLCLKLWMLDPFVCNEGLLRIGGRMRKSFFDENIKHPVLLPKECAISKLIIRHHHSNVVKHSGRTTTINSIRQSGLWIIGVNYLVRGVINKCTTCRALRGKMGEQKMADLPESRFSTEGPFTYTGLDMFGPFYVKEGRKEHKRFVILFTCMSSRAIHLESMINMETDSFIQALRRFFSRRGYVREITSDNGKNFVGAENEWKKAYDLMDHSRINAFLLERSCDLVDWKKNPPSASHMGGVWERQIRSVRNVLTGTLREQSNALNDESFRTLLTEAECIVNSRPLTVENLADPSSMPLSPSNVLTMKTRIVLPPPGIFQREDMYCRKRWRQVQYLANQFWSRWKKEYLSGLQKRQKWGGEKRNFRINDIVLVKDENLPRNQWPLARVVKVFASKDKLVRRVQLLIPTSKSELQRPIHKLVLLVAANDASDNDDSNADPDSDVSVM